MKIVCAWCKAVLHHGPAHKVSHGICASCATQVYPDGGALSTPVASLTRPCDATQAEMRAHRARLREIERLAAGAEYGEHPKRVMAAYRAAASVLGAIMLLVLAWLAIH